MQPDGVCPIHASRAPDKKPIYEEVDANAIGQDDKTWVVKLDVNKKKIWTRLKLGPAIFKQTEC